MLVKVPSFSVWAAAGSRNTSVPMSSVRSSPVSISGALYQNDAVSVSTSSRTTSQSSLAMALRWRPALGEPTAGFSPGTKNPLQVPSSMAMTVGKIEWSPVSLGRWSKQKSLAAVARSPNQALSRLTM